MLSKRNGHQTSFPKPIRLYSWRQRIADNLSAWALPITCVLGFIVVLLDVFIWRP